MACGKSRAKRQGQRARAKKPIRRGSELSTFALGARMAVSGVPPAYPAIGRSVSLRRGAKTTRGAGLQLRPGPDSGPGCRAGRHCSRTRAGRNAGRLSIRCARVARLADRVHAAVSDPGWRRGLRGGDLHSPSAPTDESERQHRLHARRTHQERRQHRKRHHDVSDAARHRGRARADDDSGRSVEDLERCGSRERFLLGKRGQANPLRVPGILRELAGRRSWNASRSRSIRSFRIGCASFPANSV